MRKATKIVWNDNIVQVGKQDIALGFPDREEPFIFRVDSEFDAEEIKLNLLEWLQSHILASGGAGPDEGLSDQF